MSYTYYITKRFKNTSDLSDFLNGIVLKTGSGSFASSGNKITASSGGFGTDTFDNKRIVLSGSSSDLTISGTDSDTVIALSGAGGKSDGDTVSYKIYTRDEIAPADIVELSQDHSNLWVLIYKVTTAAF